MPAIPFSATLLFLGIVLILVLFYPLFLMRTATNAGRSAGRARRIALFSVGGIGLWLLLTGIAAANGFFDDFSTLPPRFAAAFVPALLAVILLAALPRVRAFIASAPASWLIYIQAFRVLVELMLYQLHGAGIVPEQMTFRGMNFDIIAGATALPVGWLARRGSRGGMRLAQIWNAVGLALVLTIATVSVLSAPTPFRLFTEGPANTFIARLPFIWLPAFVVPSAILFHLWSLGRLRRREREISP